MTACSNSVSSKLDVLISKKKEERKKEKLRVITGASRPTNQQD